METYLKLNKINNDNINQTICDETIFLALQLKKEIIEKRKKFSKSLKKIKNIYIEKCKQDAYTAAKNDFINKFIEANNFYQTCIVNANKDCLDVALKIAYEITQKEFTQNSELLIRKIDLELKKLSISNKYKIICNDYIASNIRKEDINLEIIIDNTLNNLSAYILSNAGSIQIDINDEFEFLKNKLKENLQNIC